MIAIEINFLTRRYVATAHHDRRGHEWPPDPARVFSALVATWADADAPDPDERAALEWLEAQSPPAVVASDAVDRKVVSYFVPVNDASVISPASYRKRAERIEESRDALTDALFESDGEITRTVRGIQTRIRRQQDVSTLVASAGRTNLEAALELLPEGRGKQERWFPSVTPAEPRVVYIWAADPAQPITSALDRLLARVTRLGHSSSLVSCRLTEDPPAPTYVPGDGLKVMRSVRRGQLIALERAHEQHKAVKPRALPSTPVRYRTVSAGTGGVQRLRANTAGEWLVLEFRPGSRNLPATRAAEVATTLRKAIFSYAADPLPEGLSGHQPSGAPSTRLHVGFLALPWVGHAHADGRLMGVAIGVPDGLSDESKRALLRAVGTWEREASPLRLLLGRQGVLEMERPTGSSALASLRPRSWHRPSRRWVSVIPVALPTHPGRLTGGTASARGAAWRRAEQAVIDSCRHVGLPEPADVVVSLDPFVAGALPAFMFPAFRQRGPNGESVARRLVHVAVTFDQPLEGPLVLGAGRFVGIGLMRPSHLMDGDDE
jgi:CRISPR-associated protein Csb2